MRVLTDEIFGTRVEVGEIAPPTAGDADFLTRCFRVIYDQRVGTSVGGGHKACGASAKDEGVDLHVPQVAQACRFGKCGSLRRGYLRQDDTVRGAQFAVEFLVYMR